jgi:hypothetical protein
MHISKNPLELPLLSFSKCLALWSALLFAVLLLSACSSSPSDAELAQALSGGDPLIGQVYVIKNLKRLNGYDNGSGRYIVEFSCDIILIESPADYLSRIGKRSTESASVIGTIASFGLAIGAAAKWGLLNSAVLVSKQKGDVVPFAGKIEMLKSEKGWIVNPIN